MMLFLVVLLGHLTRSFRTITYGIDDCDETVRTGRHCEERKRRCDSIRLLYRLLENASRFTRLLYCAHNDEMHKLIRVV